MLSLKLICVCLIFFCYPRACRLEECSRTICVTNSGNVSCHLPAAEFQNVITHINELRDDAIECNKIQVQLSSGYHQLMENLVFSQSEQHINISGSPISDTFIQCNQRELLFDGKGSTVRLSHITFINCSMNDSWGALVFKNVSYTLYRIKVTGSIERGINAYDCYQQRITECEFTKNKGHIMIVFSNKSSKSKNRNSGTVVITSCILSSGDALQGGGILMQLDSKIITITITISNSTFQNNSATQYGSHALFTTKYRYTADILWNINIFSCTFIRGSGQDTYGLVALSRGKELKFNVIIRECLFSNNQNGAIEINSRTALIDKCQIKSNKGIGLVALFNDTKAIVSATVTIRECLFEKNENGAIKISSVNTVLIEKSKIEFNKEFGLIASIETKLASNSRITIRECLYNNNSNKAIELNGTKYALIDKSQVRGTGGTGLLVTSESKTLQITIRECLFSINQNWAININILKNLNKMVTNIRDCSIINNQKGASIEVNYKATLTIDNCTIKENKGIGINLTASKLTKITNTIFRDNSKALSIHLLHHKTQTVQMYNCTFSGHKISFFDNTPQSVVYIVGNGNPSPVTLDHCSFEKNQGGSVKCSSLHIRSTNFATLIDTKLINNDCTGIMLESSHLRISEEINIIGNAGMVGGALQLSNNSRLTFERHSQLNIIKNIATMYGGGIYLDQSCTDELKRNCFFEYEPTRMNQEKLLNFKDNSAGVGGDAIFGGCLSNCSLPSGLVINVQSDDNVFWDIVTSQNTVSQSIFAEYSDRVVFCSNESAFMNTTYDISVNTSMEVTVYRGQQFRVPLMLVDDSYFPSLGVIRAEVKSDNATLVGQDYRLANKYCDYYTYSLKSKEDVTEISVELFIQKERYFYETFPAFLSIKFQNCPLGFRLKGEICKCYDKKHLHGIECESNQTLTLKVPTQKWIGEFEGKLAIQENCQNCRDEEDSWIIHNVSSESDNLCKPNRTGISCGECIDGYSLKLGGYECDYCSSTSYKGVLLIVFFVVCGILLIAILLQLNLTVSSGLVNGLIFYSNIIHANSEAFLPITEDPSNIHLQNTVQFLSGFQAWLNLDFGIRTCFFNHLTTYHITWLQFLFPIYIWLLILIIVFASRYSRRISKWTKSNIVSVLATLLLLSYTKLLITVIGALSYTRLYFPDGGLSYPVWLLDGNIRYSSGKHIPLLLMSIFMAVGYIIPFTFLVSFGFLLQAKSEYKIFRWINKIVPLLDAFYAPYTKNYRSWPGMLLFTRLMIFIVSALYSYGDNGFLLVFIAANLLFLFSIYIIISKIYKVASMHVKERLDYLEFFFLSNLMLFIIATVYFRHTRTDGGIMKQQIVCVVMLGSVFAVTCGIILYQLLSAIKNTNVGRRIQQHLTAAVSTRKDAEIETENASQADKSINGTPTHNTVQLQDLQIISGNQLREPLLTT